MELLAVVAWRTKQPAGNGLRVPVDRQFIFLRTFVRPCGGMRCKRVSGRLKYFLGGALLCAPLRGNMGTKDRNYRPHPAGQKAWEKAGSGRSSEYRASWNGRQRYPFRRASSNSWRPPRITRGTSAGQYGRAGSHRVSLDKEEDSISPAPSPSPRCGAARSHGEGKPSRNPRRPRFSGTDHALSAE